MSAPVRAPVPGKRARRRRWPVTAASLVVGIGLGLGMTAIVPQLEGWRIVITRSPTDDGAAGSGSRVVGAQGLDDRAQIDTASAAPDQADAQPPAEAAPFNEQPVMQGAADPASGLVDPEAAETAEAAPIGSAQPSAIRSSQDAEVDLFALDTVSPPRDPEPQAETESTPSDALLPSEADISEVTELAALENVPLFPRDQDSQANPDGPDANLTIPTLAPAPRTGTAPSPNDTGEGETPLAAMESRVVLHYPPNASGPAEAAAQALSAVGVANVSVREADVSISSANVRFFHAADRGVAEDIASVLSDTLTGEDVAPRSFVDFRPKPDEGLIEIWLSGEAPTPVAAVSRTPTPNRPSPQDLRDAERQRLVQSIADRLRQRLQ